MGSLCVLPLSCMESVFRFMCGNTGSAVCCVCFICVVSIDLVLCRETWGWVFLEICVGLYSVVFGVGVLCVHKFLEAPGNAVKVCGHQICGNWTYPIAFA